MWQPAFHQKVVNISRAVSANLYPDTFRVSTFTSRFQPWRVANEKSQLSTAIVKLAVPIDQQWEQGNLSTRWETHITQPQHTRKISNLLRHKSRTRQFNELQQSTCLSIWYSYSCKEGYCEPAKRMTLMVRKYRWIKHKQSSLSTAASVRFTRPNAFVESKLFLPRDEKIHSLQGDSISCWFPPNSENRSSLWITGAMLEERILVPHVSVS